MDQISKEKGNYIVVFNLETEVRIENPRFGEISLLPGYYLYCGSAHGHNGLRGRISRHLSKPSKKFWHIDYLKEYLIPIEVWYQICSEKNECHFLQFLHDQLDGNLPIIGFGSSDCRAGCDSHLVFFPLGKNLDQLFSNLKIYFSEIHHMLVQS